MKKGIIVMIIFALVLLLLSVFKLIRSVKRREFWNTLVSLIYIAICAIYCFSIDVIPFMFLAIGSIVLSILVMFFMPISILAGFTVTSSFIDVPVRTYLKYYKVAFVALYRALFYGAHIAFAILTFLA